MIYAYISIEMEIEFNMLIFIEIGKELNMLIFIEINFFLVNFY